MRFRLQHRTRDREARTPGPERQGSSVVEFGLVAALVAVVAITAMATLGPEIPMHWLSGPSG